MTTAYMEVLENSVIELEILHEWEASALLDDETEGEED